MIRLQAAIEIAKKVTATFFKPHEGRPSVRRFEWSCGCLLRIMFLLLFFSLSLAGPSIEASCFFVNPAYVFRDSAGHERVNVSRSGVGVGGLKREKLIPCTPDAEVESRITVSPMRGDERLGEHGFEHVVLRRHVADTITRQRQRFVSTLGNVMETTKHASYRAVANVMFLSLDPFAIAEHLTLSLTCQGLALSFLVSTHLTVIKGFIVRKVLPMGIPADPSFAAAAQGMHIDQDLSGEPLRSMGVSWLFRWLPLLHLVNVWTPLKSSPIRPLVLMDRRSLQRPIRHSWGNDIILIGASAEHRYFYAPITTPGTAHVFLTGYTPHSSISVPGEECMSLANCSTARPEIWQLIKDGNRSDWVRESLEMRCAVIIVPEWIISRAIFALTAILFTRLVLLPKFDS